MIICEYCEKIFSTELDGSNTLRPFEEFEADSELSCSLCRYFKQDIVRPSWATVDKLVFRHHHYHETDLILPLWNGVPRLPILELQLTVKSGAAPRPVTYRAFTTGEGRLASRFSGRLIEREGTSSAALNRLIEMVDHQIPAGSDTHPLMPTRVLDVGVLGDKIFLKLTKGLRGQWVALSHCWDRDPSRHFKTTTACLQKFALGIDFVELPRTFQDAVTVTRKLGHKHLWIDSLCIIQGFDGDWSSESLKMGTYYGESFVTISADCAKGDSDGFLKQRDAISRYIYSSNKNHYDSADTVYSDEVDQFTLSDDESDRQLYLKRVSWVGHASKKNPVETSPLQHRGWTLQERCLSRYIIHFGEEQNYLELVEQGQILYEDGRCVEYNTYWRDLYADARCLPYRRWYLMVEDYMQRHLSFRSDTLLAISSLAQNIGEIVNDTYIAGLWQTDLAHGLLWATKNPGAPIRWRSNSPDIATTRLEFPSWSWASAASGVFFLLNDLANTVDIESVLLGYDSRAAVEDEDESLFSLVRVEGSGEAQDTTNQRLDLVAPVFDVIALTFRETPNRFKSEDQSFVILAFDEDLYSFEAFMDKPKGEYTVERPPKMFAICIARKYGGSDSQNVITGTVATGPKCIYGLVVTEVMLGSQVCYQRIGVFEDKIFSRDKELFPRTEDMCFKLWSAARSNCSQKAITLI